MILSKKVFSKTSKYSNITPQIIEFKNLNDFNDLISAFSRP